MAFLQRGAAGLTGLTSPVVLYGLPELNVHSMAYQKLEAGRPPTCQTLAYHSFELLPQADEPSSARTS